MLVLSLLEGGDMYGYQMIEELSRRSNDLFQMKEGTLYPILHGLEKDRCLSSYQRDRHALRHPSPHCLVALGIVYLDNLGMSRAGLRLSQKLEEVFFQKMDEPPAGKAQKPKGVKNKKENVCTHGGPTSFSLE